MMTNYEKNLYNLYDAREKIFIPFEWYRHVVISTGSENIWNNKTLLKKDIIEYFSQKENLKGDYIFSFSKNFNVRTDGEEKKNNSYRWQSWNSFSFEKFVNRLVENYIFIILEQNNLDSLIHVIHFKQEDLDKLLKLKKLTSNGVYYFYFCQEKDIKINEIWEKNFTSLSGTWQNGKKETIIIQPDGTISNKSWKIRVPERLNEKNPWLDIRAGMTGFAMGLYNIGLKNTTFDGKIIDQSDWTRPRLILTQNQVNFPKESYYYRVL